MKLKHTILAVSATLFGSAALAGGCDYVTNVAAWTSNQNPAGKLDITAAGAMGGSCTLAVTTAAQPGGQASKHFVQDSSPVDEARYRGAFCLDINDMVLNTGGANRRVKVHNVQCSTGAGPGCGNTDIVQFKIEQDSVEGIRFDMFVRDSNIGNTKNRNYINLPNAPVRVEYDLDLTAGSFKLWLDATSESDTPVLDLSGMDTAAWNGVDRARLGSQDRSGNVPVDQVFYMDEFESRRSTFIGGSCAP